MDRVCETSSCVPLQDQVVEDRNWVSLSEQVVDVVSKVQVSLRVLRDTPHSLGSAHRHHNRTVQPQPQPKQHP